MSKYQLGLTFCLDLIDWWINFCSWDTKLLKNASIHQNAYIHCKFKIYDYDLKVMETFCKYAGS